MAIKPHCVVCGRDPAGSVTFADYNPGWQEPQVLGWSNELGVTAPPGVGLFCARHLWQARLLARMRGADAVARLGRLHALLARRRPLRL